jgi:thiol-disulfide isomerase/thioredoxin
MRILFVILTACFLNFGVACAQGSSKAEHTPKEVHATERTHDDPRPYEGDRDAMADVDAALALAELRGTKALIVMGANWCHDSRALAGRFEQPEFQTLIANNYELVYVSAGTKPGQNNQNRDVSKRFGVDKIGGTPTIFITAGDGSVLNNESTGYWKRAESIPVDMSYAYFDYYAQK